MDSHASLISIYKSCDWVSFFMRVCSSCVGHLFQGIEFGRFQVAWMWDVEIDDCSMKIGD